MNVTPREYYETGCVDTHANKINEGDEVVIYTVLGPPWKGTIFFEKGQFKVEYEDKSVDPLEDVAHVCEITKSFNHANFNDVLKRKIKQLEKDLIESVIKEVEHEEFLKWKEHEQS